MADRPNILLVMVDQLADQWLDLAVTPAVDQLADRGFRFGAAYTPSPLCAPARFAMMSGRLNSTIGAYDNASEFPAKVPTMAHHLRAAGYQTSLIGKMHFVGPDQLHGYEERLTTDIYPADFGWTPNWDNPDHRFDWWFHNMDSVTGAGVAEATNQLDFDDEVGFLAVRKLRDLARSRDRRPWFVTVSFTHPHDPYVARRQYWDRYDPATVPLPAVTKIDDPDPHSVRLARVMAADQVVPSDAQIVAARRAYLANTSYVDDFVGQLLETLDVLSMSDDTTVIFTSDHGDMLGERGLWYKMNFFEPSARVPLIVAGAGLPSGNGTVDVPVSLLDLVPTMIDLAGADGHEAFDEPVGDSLLGLLDQENASAPDRTVVGEYLGEGAMAPIFMMRSRSWKFVWSPVDPPQLYDLATDPHELDNLAPRSPLTSTFEAEIERRWDVEAIDRQVRTDQARRRLVAQALRQGQHTPWDHQPVVDASSRYMRNHLDLNDVEAGRRV